MALKDASEGEGSVTFLGHSWCKHSTQQLHILIDAFGGPKAPKWGGLIQVAPETQKTKRAEGSSKIKVFRLLSN